MFHLEGYPARSKEPEPIDEEGYILRTKLKKEFKSMGFAASVQTEVDNNRWVKILIMPLKLMLFSVESGFELPL